MLLVDDDDALRERLAEALRKRGWTVLAAKDGTSALAQAQSRPPSCALVDLRMPGEWGLHVVQRLKATQPDVPVVVFSAYGSIATALEALRLGACHFLQKPATVDEILHAFAHPALQRPPHPADHHTRPPDAPPAASDPANTPAAVPSLARAEWEHINRVLTECDGNIRQAARLLGLHRRTLQRKLAKYPVRR